jgi:anthranilate/para-aminobenzoate synthase component II
MMEIQPGGTVQMAAGSTLVRDSDPMSEAQESTTKLSALAASLGSCSQKPALPELPPFQEALAPVLAERNTRLSRFFFENQTGKDLSVETLRGKRITIVMSDDDFAHTLGHMARRMGAEVNIVQCRSYDVTKDDADLVMVGPGTGNPSNMDDPKMRSLAAILIDLQHTGRPFMSVCLGHQLCAKLLGLELERKENPSQGIPKDIDFFGTPQRVGFYNTFVAKNADVPEGSVCADPVTGEVHAIRGKNFSSFQFHPESVLTENGFDLLRNELVRVLRGVDPAAAQEAIDAVRSIDLSRVMKRLGKIRSEYSPERITEALEEYRRYFVLAKLFPDVDLIPPTEECDEVWHNHLLHSIDYADDCERVLGEFLHHQPGEGEMPIALYRETLELYRAVFGCEPKGTLFT